DVIAKANQVYETFNDKAPQLKIILQTYFEHIFSYLTVTEFPVAAIGLDFVHGDSLELIKENGFPKDKVLAAGIVDGRNVWTSKLEEKLAELEKIKAYVKKDTLIVQPSTSLLHVPVTVKLEEKLDTGIKSGLAFADEKITEIVTLVKGLTEGKESIRKEIGENKKQLKQFNESADRINEEVRKEIEQLSESDVTRSSAFAERIQKQDEQLDLPLFPTTTIGSLPQTQEVRKTRTNWRKGDIN